MKKTILFYYHNFGGLGHGNRLSLIIKKIINDFYDDYNVIVLNSGEKQDFLFPECKNLKIINLPNYKIENYTLIENDQNKKVHIYRREVFKKLLSVAKAESIIIEHYPFGRNFLDTEIKFIINEYKKHNDKGNVLSSVRDVFDLNALKKENLRLFDRFLIHGDEKIFNYEKYFEKGINRKIVYTGYVVNEYKKQKQEEKNHILISIGGGQDGLNFIKDFLEKLKATRFDGKLFINIGKLYSEENIEEIKKLTNLKTDIKPYFDNFLEIKRQAKLVVSMGGYNNFMENLFYKKKSIIYHRITDNEQKDRLESLSKKINFIYDGNKLKSNNIQEILDYSDSHDKLFLDFNGAYFSASFILNFKKYEYIKIRLTNACNATCDMCGVIKRKREYNDLIKIKKSILDFYKLGGEVVNFTGGEPTIYKGFFDLLEFSKNLGLITSVSTNGSLLGDSFYKKITRNGNSIIDYMDISVDGLHDLHDKIRGIKGLFATIEKNIKRLKDLSIFIHINYTIRKDNIALTKDFFDFFKQKKVDSISFSMISTSPVNDTTYLFPDKESLKKFYLDDKKYILENKSEIKLTFSPDFNNGNFDKFCDFIINKNSFEKSNGKNCDFIKSKKEIRINENGNVTPCCILDDYDEHIGNIGSSNLLDIICSKTYEDFLNKKFPHISSACLNCKIEI